MGFIDVNGVSFSLPDGRPLLADLAFRVTEGRTTALIGANGAGKSTLLRIVRGDLRPDEGSVQVDGGLGVMDQFVGTGRTVAGRRRDRRRPARLGGADARARRGARARGIRERAHRARRHRDADARTRPRSPSTPRPAATTRRSSGTTARWRRSASRSSGRSGASSRTLSGGEQKRLALEALLRGPEQVLLLDEPDNSLDVPGKRWLEAQLRATPKTVLLVSHDRELLARAADRIVTLEVGAAGNTAWVHGGSFEGYHEAREERFERLDELRRRWDEQHAALKQLVATLKVKATYNDGMASRYQAARHAPAQVRGGGPARGAPARAGRLDAAPRRPHGQARGRVRATRAHRADEAVRPRGLVRRPRGGARLERLGQVALPAAARGRRHRARPHARARHDRRARRSRAVPHAGRAVLGARVVPGWFAQNHEHPEFRGPHAARHPASGRRQPRRHGARGGELGARPLRARRRRAADGSSRSRAASRRACRSCCSSSRAPRCCCSTSRPTTSTSSRPRRSRTRSRASRAPCSRSPTTAGSRAASTGSSCSAPTARSSSGCPGLGRGAVVRARS